MITQPFQEKFNQKLIKTMLLKVSDSLASEIFTELLTLNVNIAYLKFLIKYKQISFSDK